MKLITSLSFFALTLLTQKYCLASESFSVNYIGDSHSDYAGNRRGTFGFLGERLKELMKERGFSFSLYAASGSVPSWWTLGQSTQAATWGYTQTASFPPMKTCFRGNKKGTCVPKLDAILKSFPDLIVIEQGTNMLGYSSAKVASQVNGILAQVNGKAKSCLWVAAPRARTTVHSESSQQQLIKLIKGYASQKCHVYDSRFLPATDSLGNISLDGNGNPVMGASLPYSPDSNNDGEHLSMSAAGKWATGVDQVIRYLISHRN